MNTTKVPARPATTGHDTRPRRRKVAVCDAHTTFTAGCPECRRKSARYNKARALPSWQPQLPALGTTRLLRGLAVQGWPARVIAEMTGLTMRQVQHLQQGRAVQVRPVTARAVARVAARIDHRQGPSDRSATIARRHGWAPLAAWDDPATDTHPQGVAPPPEDAWDRDVRALHAQGLSDVAIAARVDGLTTTRVRERRLALGLPATNRYGHPVRQDAAS